MQKISFFPAVAAAWLGACAGSSEVPDAPPLPQISATSETTEARELDGSLVAYIDAALASRPELAATLERWRAQKRRINSIDEMPSPTVSYMVALNTVGHRAGVEQPIPWPGKAAARTDVERAAELVEATRYDAQVLDVAWQVADAYWQLWGVEREHRWHQEHLRILAALAQAARSKVETGQALVADVGQMELEQSRTSDMVSRSHQAHQRASYQLAWAAGLDVARDALPVRSEPPAARVVAEGTDALVASAHDNPRVLALLRMQDVRTQEAEAARTAIYPDFGVGVQYEMEPMPAAMGDDAAMHMVMAGVSVRVPLWIGESRALADAAEAERAALEADAEALRREAARAVRQSLAALEESAQRIELHESTLLPQAEAVLQSVRGAYEVGKTDIASLLRAQDELLDIRIELARARAEHERQWVGLERLVGRPVRGEEMQ